MKETDLKKMILTCLPQGSILGPIMFDRYLKDISLTLDEVFYHVIADDTVICLTGIDMINAVNVMNDLLNGSERIAIKCM